jgi:hypothetical protein
MGVYEYVQVMRSDPRKSDVGGLSYETVVLRERQSRYAYREAYGSTEEILGVWRAWSALQIRMLWDDLSECPHAYRWEPDNLTC